MAGWLTGWLVDCHAVAGWLASWLGLPDPLVTEDSSDLGSIQVAGLGSVCIAGRNCVDCWPYPVPQWAVSLMVVALMLIIVVLLALRIAAVKKMRRAEAVPAGRLDTEGMVLKLQAQRAQEIREEKAIV